MAARCPAGGANGFSMAPMSQSGRDAERPPGQQQALVAHGAGGLDEADAVEVEHGLGAGVVAEPGVVAGHQQHVRDAQRARRDQVRLQREPVAVAAGELHDRLDPRLGRQQAARPARHPHVRARVVGDVHGVHPAAQRSSLRPMALGSAPRGGLISAVTANWPDPSRARSPPPRDHGEPPGALARWPPGAPARRRPADLPPLSGGRRSGKADGRVLIFRVCNAATASGSRYGHNLGRQRFVACHKRQAVRAWRRPPWNPPGRRRRRAAAPRPHRGTGRVRPAGLRRLRACACPVTEPGAGAPGRRYRRRRRGPPPGPGTGPGWPGRPPGPGRRLAAPSPARSRARSVASGIVTPGTSWARNSASSKLRSGASASSTGTWSAASSAAIRRNVRAHKPGG